MKHIIIILVTGLFLSACGSAHYPLHSESPAQIAQPSTEEANANLSQQRRIEKNARINVEVKDVDQAEKQLISEIDRLGGYVKSSNKEDDENSYLTISVPPKKLFPALDYISSLGKEISRAITSNDVTLQYIDLQARLDNLKALRNRLKNLLEKSNEIDKLLEVEKEIARVQTQIDRIAAQLNFFKITTAESTITTQLNKKHRAGPVVFIAKSIKSLGKKLFYWD